MDFHQAAALVIFCAVVLLTVVLVLVPLTVHLPASCSRRLRLSSFSISYAVVPVLGTLVMLMTGVLDGQSLAAGIVGDEHMKPYGIVILFMALAYMSSGEAEGLHAHASRVCACTQPCPHCDVHVCMVDSNSWPCTVRYVIRVA
jgi:hypothetical protein